MECASFRAIRAEKSRAKCSWDWRLQNGRAFFKCELQKVYLRPFSNHPLFLRHANIDELSKIMSFFSKKCRSRYHKDGALSHLMLFRHVTIHPTNENEGSSSSNVARLWTLSPLNSAITLVSGLRSATILRLWTPFPSNSANSSSQRLSRIPFSA